MCTSPAVQLLEDRVTTSVGAFDEGPTTRAIGCSRCFQTKEESEFYGKGLARGFYWRVRAAPRLGFGVAGH